MKKNIFITQKIPVIAENILKEAGFAVRVNKSGKRLTQAELIKHLKNTDAVLSLLSDKINAEIIRELKKCRIIANYAVGYNNIDVAAAKGSGIMVTNTPDVLTDATADLTIALMLAAARHIVTGDRFMRDGMFTGWQPFLFTGVQLSSSTIGIIGAGRIGTAVAKRVHAFGAKIVYSSNHSNREIEKKYKGIHVPLESLMAESDIITIHTPLNANTNRLLNKSKLDLLKKNCILVNTARGEIVDEYYLIELLKKKKILAAGLDVYDKEPMVNHELYKLDNVVLAPHTGSATVTARTQMAEIAAKNVVAVLSGNKPLTPVYK